MNDDPSDDENELEIKWTMFIGFIGLFATALITVMMLTGCATHMKEFRCECDCEDSSFDCKINSNQVKPAVPPALVPL